LALFARADDRNPASGAMTLAVTIEVIAPGDISAVTAIYTHWVLHGTGTFEVDPPEPQEMSARIDAIRKCGLPWLVARQDKIVVGYAYAGPFRPRTAYRYSVENSVYVTPERNGRGVGATLLEALIAHCESLGVRQMLAVIGDSANLGSIALHESAGFVRAGMFKNVGFKFGRWLDIVLMQREIGKGAHSLPSPDEGWKA
jgi:phosphinothricin acetyltransferase